MSERKARNPKHRAWTAQEEEVIRRVYPHGGTKAVAEELPHRTPDAIKKTARRLKVRSNAKDQRLIDAAHRRRQLEDPETAAAMLLARQAREIFARIST